MFTDRTRENDHKLRLQTDTRRNKDVIKRRAQKQEQWEDDRMKSKDMNLITLQKGIKYLDKYDNPQHLGITNQVKEITKNLKRIYDYKVQWLHEPSKSQQLKEEQLRFEGESIEPEKLDLGHYTSRPAIIRPVALDAFEGARGNIQVILGYLEAGHMKDSRLTDTLKEIKPLFEKAKAHEKFSAIMPIVSKNVSSPDVSFGHELYHEESPANQQVTSIKEVPPYQSTDQQGNLEDTLMRRFLDKTTLGKIFTKDVIHAVGQTRDSTTGETCKGYKHLFPLVNTLRGYSQYSSYKYSEATSAYQKIKKAFDDGTYNKFLKKRCEKFGFPFAQNEKFPNIDITPQEKYLNLEDQ
jgi:hypothetical protein